ncbi:MAG: radical SAM protein, partial [Spirochaetia bacterium]|nr:radical SAM protein [Spirochaetia bacterium]
LAMFGCNLQCSFCQNYTISQSQYRSDSVRPPTKAGELVSLALRSGCPSISFTYSEPLVWQDYLIEVAIAAKQANLKTIMVSNGTFSEESLERLVPHIDAFNIDLKGDESFYQRICKGSAKPVIDSLYVLGGKAVHLEVTTMVMQGEHTLEDIRAIGTLLQEMGVHIWHLSRYFPNYQAHLEATKESFLKEILQTVQETSIDHVYGGNSFLNQNTYCPSCKNLLVRRDAGVSVYASSFVQGTCQACGQKIYGCFPS